MDSQALLAVGQRLSEARTSRGISLEQAEEETRIRLKYLAAMETGDFDALPNIVVARGFLRNYAQYLGLDPQPLLDMVDSVYPNPVTQPLQRAVTDSGPHVLEMDLGRQSGGRVGTLLGLLGILLLVAVAVLWLNQSGKIQLPGSFSRPAATPPSAQGQGIIVTPEPTSLPPSPTPVQAAAIATPTPTIPAAIVPTRAPTATATPTPASTPTLVPTSTPTRGMTPTATPVASGNTDQVTVQAQVVDRAWMRVRVDGETVLEGLIDPGKEFTWTGKVVEVRTGNAGGVRLVVNGQDLGLLGQTGDVQHWVFYMENGEVKRVLPTPTPTPGVGAPAEGTP